ncbi:MAG: PAS domain S-box protein [Desulfobacteraceae bacterium]|nr:MAG: PAS domain S-box protein [Desulfobacteraceae bacterium]
MDKYLDDKRPDQQVRIQEREIASLRETVEALMESGNKYRSIIENIEDGYYEVDLTGNFIFFNESMARMLGYSGAELMGMNNREFMDPENAKKVFQTFHQVYASGKPSKAVDWALIKKDGEKCHIDTSVSLVRDANQQPIGFHGIARDITARMRFEEVMQRERFFSESLINSMPGIFYLFDATGKFIRWNRNFESVSEYTGDEIASMSPADLFEGRDREHIIRRIQQVFREGQADAEADFLSKSGRRIPHYFTGKLIHIENRPFLIGMGIDITDRKKAEESLKISQELYRQVVENANDAIIILQDGMIVFHNSRTETLTGYSKEELVRIPFISFVIPEDKDAVSKRYFKKLNGENFGGAFSFGILNKNGEELWVEVNTVVVSWKGKPAIQCFIRDVSRQRKLETQLRQAHKMEAIGTLAGGIAHDFNNVISILLGNIEMAMIDVPETNSARQNLEASRKVCLRARDMVNQILSFSRQTKNEPRSVNLAEIINESLTLLRFSIPATIAVHSDIPETPPAILADPSQIHQVIINLCANAAHVMREKGGVIDVRLEEMSLERTHDKSSVGEGVASPAEGLSTGRYMVLSVGDTGGGIPSGIRGRIFDPYFTTKKIGEGSGMGLAVVHGIVKAHGGAVHVDSEPGRGSVFRVFFPVIEGDAAAEKKNLKPVTGGSERILYVDDDPLLVEIGEQMLEYLGYQVTSSTSSVEALALFRSDPGRFDLVITDMTMPRMNGGTLARELIAVKSDIPIILNTGYSDQIDEETAGEIGIKAYLLKPLTMSDLAEAIRKALGENQNADKTET